MKTKPQQTASIRSPWPTHGHPLHLLSDRKIETYILKGFYGRDRQEHALAVKEAKARCARSAPKSRDHVAPPSFSLTPDLY
jgi:hypothetical protein